jgi:hypothetical protein
MTHTAREILEQLTVDVDSPDGVRDWDKLYNSALSSLRGLVEERRPKCTHTISGKVEGRYVCSYCEGRNDTINDVLDLLK